MISFCVVYLGERGSAGMLHGFEVRHAPGGRHSIREFRKYPDRLTGEGAEPLLTKAPIRFVFG